MLDLADNRIDDLTAVGALTSLVILDVSDNRVTDLSPLAGLEILSELRVRGNRVEDLSALSGRAGLRIAGCWGSSMDRTSDPVAAVAPRFLPPAHRRFTGCRDRARRQPVEIAPHHGSARDHTRRSQTRVGKAGPN